MQDVNLKAMAALADEHNLKLEINPGSTLGEKLLDAWFNKIITKEKLKTIIEISPAIKVVKRLLAVSVLFTTKIGACSTKYLDTPRLSR